MGFLSDMIGIGADIVGGTDPSADIRMMEMHNAMDANNERMRQDMDHQNEMRRQQQRSDDLAMHFLRTRSY